MSVALRFDNLTLGYDRHPAVHHLTGAIDKGGLLAIVGPNGAGKSTLLKGVVGALKPIDGDIHVAAGETLAYLPQSAEIDRAFPLTVFEFIAMGQWRRRGLFGGFGGGERKAVAAAIDTVGLAGFEQRAIGTLSGGQMQRMLFARLLLQDASLILLDEPFTAIDETTTRDLLGLIRRWHAESRTIVAVLHDLALVREVFPQSLLLARERVAWGPTGETLSPGNLLAARRMVEAFDEAAHVCERAA
jgi:zinc/manganese transport system ATP-binding protein